MKKFKNKIVKVKVDRPIGSAHPKYSDVIYPVNYGFVEGVFAPDGEEQDVYILGVDHPVEVFWGRVIAVIHRKNDVEDKLVVAPDGVAFTLSEIREKTMFQEKYFDINITLI